MSEREYIVAMAKDLQDAKAQNKIMREALEYVYEMEKPRIDSVGSSSILSWNVARKALKKVGGAE